MWAPTGIHPLFFSAGVSHQLQVGCAQMTSSTVEWPASLCQRRLVSVWRSSKAQANGRCWPVHLREEQGFEDGVLPLWDWGACPPLCFFLWFILNSILIKLSSVSLLDWISVPCYSYVFLSFQLFPPGSVSKLSTPKPWHIKDLGFPHVLCG